MIVFLGLLCTSFQGSSGVQLLVEMDKTVSLFDTDRNNSKLLFTNFTSVISVDYHYTKGLLYWTERQFLPHWKGNLMRLNLTAALTEPDPSPPELLSDVGMLSVTVDWVRNVLYMFNRDWSLLTSDLDGNNLVIIINKKEKLPTIPGASNYTFVERVQVDPYEELLFISIWVTEGSYIIKTDLSGKNARLHREKLYTLINLVLETKERKLYIVEPNKVHICSYDGKRLGEFSLNMTPRLVIGSLENMLYLTHFSAIRITLSQLTFDSSGNSSHRQDLLDVDSSCAVEELCKSRGSSDLHLGTLLYFTCVDAGVTVYDVRRQRRYRNGEYECERKDCEYQCRVDPVFGDSCFCPHNFRLKSDNRTCIEAPCTIEKVGNRVFGLFPCPRGQNCTLEQGVSVPHEGLITVTCDKGYSFPSEYIITSCEYGVWSPSLPSCNKLCPALKSDTVEFTCYEGPFPVSCTQPVLPGTVAEYRCKEGGLESSLDPNQASGLSCGSSGEWSKRVPNCVPKTTTEEVLVFE